MGKSTMNLNAKKHALLTDVFGPEASRPETSRPETSRPELGDSDERPIGGASDVVYSVASMLPINGGVVYYHPASSPEKIHATSSTSTSLSASSSASLRGVKKTFFFSALLLSFVIGAVLIFGALRLNTVEGQLLQLQSQMQQQQQQRVQQQLRQIDETTAKEAAMTLKKRKRRRVDEEETIRKDLVHIVSDTEKTKTDTKKTELGFSAHFRDIKWRLSDETPDIPLNHAEEFGRRRRRPHSSRASVAAATSTKTNNKPTESSAFEFDPASGIVTIDKEGFYYVYSQVSFFSLYGRLRYTVTINEEDSMICRVGLQTAIPVHCNKYSGRLRRQCINAQKLVNSCNTSGLRYLHKGDQLRIKGSSMQQLVVSPMFTFFGIIKL